MGTKVEVRGKIDRSLGWCLVAPGEIEVLLVVGGFDVD